LAASATVAPSLERRFLEPEGWRWAGLTSANGARLRYGHGQPAVDPAAQIVFLTGYNEFAEKYFETIRDFMAGPYAVWILDWRGQGGSERYYANPYKIGGQGFDEDARDLDLFLREVVAAQASLPVFLVAHSTGGQIVFRYLDRYPPAVSGVVLSAPLIELRTDPVPSWLARALSRVAVTLGAGRLYVPGARNWRPGPRSAGNRATTDPVRGQLQEAWFEASPELRMGGATFTWLDAAFRATKTTALSRRWSSLGLPILIGSAGQDAYVRPEAHHRIAALLPGAQLITFPEARHELFLERDEIRREWLLAIQAFLDRCLTALSPRSQGAQARSLRADATDRNKK
jgi:lysophospholipase